MRMIVLRHSYRDVNNYRFTSELIQLGHKDAMTRILPELEKLNIGNIYTSVYPRVIQTILPYIQKNNRKIIVDDRLHEYISHTNEKYHDATTIIERYNEYISDCNIYPFDPPETSLGLFNRVYHFLLYLMSPQDKLNFVKSPLIVSHRSSLAVLLSFSDIQDKNLKELAMGQVKVIDVTNLDHYRAYKRFMYLITNGDHLKV
jgi:broad specificity phosphatase PhoE